MQENGKKNGHCNFQGFKDNWFIIIEDLEKHKIITFGKLQTGNIYHFYLKITEMINRLSK